MVFNRLIPNNRTGTRFNNIWILFTRTIQKYPRRAATGPGRRSAAVPWALSLDTGPRDATGPRRSLSGPTLLIQERAFLRNPNEEKMSLLENRSAPDDHSYLKSLYDLRWI